MPIPAYITIFYNGQKLKGAVTFPGKEDTTEALEFGHGVKFKEQDFFTGTVVREHLPLMFIKPVDSISVILYQILCKGLYIDKVIIDWYRKDEKKNKETIYFQHILEKVKICSISMIMNNVKDPRFEQYPHLEKIELRYDRICWNIPDGNIRYTDRWMFAFLIEGMNLNENAEYEKMMRQEALTDSMVDEEEKPQETLNITNPRWEHADETMKSESPDKAHTGDVIKLSVDIKGYVNQGKVTFDIYDITGSPQRIDTVPGKNEEGKASVEWPVEDPRKPDETKELKLAFEAHARSKYSDRKDIGFEENEQAFIVYSPIRDMYLMFGKDNQGDFDTFFDEVNASVDLGKKIVDARNETDPAKQLKLTADIKTEVDSFFDGVEMGSKDAIEELYVLKSNKRWGKLSSRVYIRPYKMSNNKTIKGHWRKNNDETVKKKLTKQNKTNGDDIFDVSAEIKNTFLSKDFEKQWPWTWKFSTDPDVLAKNDHFDFSSQAQFFRFAAGVSASTKLDMKECQFKVGAEGKLSYSLMEGKISGKWHIPDEDGFNLFSLVEQTDKLKPFLEKNRQCNIKLVVSSDGMVFIGASVSAAVALPNVDFSAKTRKKNKGSTADANAGADGYIGARTEGGIGCAAEWRRSVGEEFAELGGIDLSGGAGVGAGAQAKIKISYANGIFHFEIGAGLVVGVGGKAGLNLKVGLGPGVELIAHIMVCVDYHYIVEIKEEAFDAFVAVAFAWFLPVQLRKTLTALGGAKMFAGKVLEYIQKNLTDAKRTIRANVNNPYNLKNSPPETLGGNVLKTLMLSVEPDDFNAIIKVLESAKTDHELKWIIRCIVDSKAEEDGGKLLEEGIRRLLEFGKDIDKAKHETYNQRLVLLLRKNGIRYE